MHGFSWKENIKSAMEALKLWQNHDVLAEAQIPLGSSRDVSTRLDTFDTAKMHGLDTSNVSSSVETWRDEQREFGLNEVVNMQRLVSNSI